VSQRPSTEAVSIFGISGLAYGHIDNRPDADVGGGYDAFDRSLPDRKIEDFR
jgi:hypothetical protein